MTVDVSVQKAYAPIIGIGVRVSNQKAYVPIVEAFVRVSLSKAYVPVFGGTASRRRMPCFVN